MRISNHTSSTILKAFSSWKKIFTPTFTARIIMTPRIKANKASTIMTLNLDLDKVCHNLKAPGKMMKSTNSLMTTSRKSKKRPNLNSFLSFWTSGSSNNQFTCRSSQASPSWYCLRQRNSTFWINSSYPSSKNRWRCCLNGAPIFLKSGQKFMPLFYQR